MKDSLVVKICTGTACYVQGGSFLLDLEDQLTTEERERVEVQGVGCLGYCGGTENVRPPFAVIGEKLMGGIDLNALTVAVKTELNKD